MADSASKTPRRKPIQPVPAMSMDYRLGDYCGRYDLRAELLTGGKGVARLQVIRHVQGRGGIDRVRGGAARGAGASRPARPADSFTCVEVRPLPDLWAVARGDADVAFASQPQGAIA